MVVLILGSQEEDHSRWIHDKLKEKNEDAAYFDSRKYPDNILLNWSPDGIKKSSYIRTDERKIYLREIKGVYWRWFYGVQYKRIEDGANTEFLSNMVYRELQSSLNSLFASFDFCNWVNSYKAVELHKNKAHQTNILSKAGIRVPNTLITNDKEGMREFYEKNNKNIIYKPVLGGAYTKKINEEDFSPENLESLKASPVQFQEFVDGIDIRVYAFEDGIYAAEMHARTLDFREDNKALLKPVELPEKVQKDCKKVLKLLDLTYSGIDVRKNTKGEYIFIEANPAPMFIYFEKMTKYPITESLIKALLK